MPAALHLERFGSILWDAFDATPYWVGSSLPGSEKAMQGKPWRDVDVRILLADEVYEAMGLGDPDHPHQNAKWVALVLAFSELGHAMTGLPIDFQIQQVSYANDKHDGPRSALGCMSRIRSGAA